jgi:hypothetical protein
MKKPTTETRRHGEKQGINHKGHEGTQRKNLNADDTDQKRLPKLPELPKPPRLKPNTFETQRNGVKSLIR